MVFHGADGRKKKEELREGMKELNKGIMKQSHTVDTERPEFRDPRAERGPGDRQWAQQRSYRTVQGYRENRKVGRSPRGQGMREDMEDNGREKTKPGKSKTKRKENG